MHIRQVIHIVGKGRSGTTWVAHALNRHPFAVYKHEPFLSQESPYRQWLRKDRLLTDTEMRDRFSLLASDAHLGIDVPPYLPRAFKTTSGKLRHFSYAVAKRLELLEPVFRFVARYRYAGEIDLLIKDVNLGYHDCRRIWEIVDPKGLVVIRNPFGNIASSLRHGYWDDPHEKEIVFKRLRLMLETDLGAPYRQFGEKLEVLSPAALEALLWRVQNEPIVEFASRSPQHAVINYDVLAAHPVDGVQRVFDFIGWPMTREVEEFVKASTKGPAMVAREKGEKRYTTTRNSKVASNRWKRELTESQISAIRGVLDGSQLAKLWVEADSPTTEDVFVSLK